MKISDVFHKIAKHQKLSSLFCKLGLHPWEKEPSRNTGVNVLFATSAIQAATRKCEGGDCHATQDVYREGFCGIGGQAGPWKKMDEETRQRIARLPVL